MANATARSVWDDPAVVAAVRERDAALVRLLRGATAEAVFDTVVPVFRIILDRAMTEGEKARQIEAIVASMQAESAR